MTTETQKPAGWWFIGLSRIAIGIMWFQQTLWKLPWKDFGGPSGFHWWVQRTAQYGIFDWYKAFVQNVFLPNFKFFAYQVYLGETIIAVTLMLGLFGRLGGLLGGLMALNLYIGLSQSPGEWYWTYLFIALLCFIFFFTRAGRFIGLDQILAPKVEQAAREGNKLALSLIWLM